VRAMIDLNDQQSRTRGTFVVVIVAVCAAVGVSLVAASDRPATVGEPDVARNIISALAQADQQPLAPRQSPGKTPTLPGMPLTELRTTRERPIFASSRRPPLPPFVPQPQPVADDSIHPGFTLIGTIAGSAEAMAILRDQTGSQVIKLRKGESHLGWILHAVDGREATLQKGPRSAVLMIAMPPAK
jgi:general secretion pathway protein N